MQRDIRLDELFKTIIGCAIEVQRELEPGLLESAYEQLLVHELRLKGITFELQKAMPVEYRDVRSAFQNLVCVLSSCSSCSSW